MRDIGLREYRWSLICVNRRIEQQSENNGKIDPWCSTHTMDLRRKQREIQQDQSSSSRKVLEK